QQESKKMRPSRRNDLFAGVIALASVVSGCGGDPAPLEREVERSSIRTDPEALGRQVDAESYGIRNGKTASNARYATIGRLSTPQGTCTGTLISPRVVLTAARCVSTPPTDTALQGAVLPAPSITFALDDAAPREAV